VIDLSSFKQRYVTAWGDRMTVGVQVVELRQLVEELESLRDRHRLQAAQLDGALVQADYWQRMARAAYAEAEKLRLELSDLHTRYSEPPPRDEGA
jgi:hypothetical protein